MKKIAVMVLLVVVTFLLVRKLVLVRQIREAEEFRASARWGYIDKTGTMVIPVQFGKAEAFSEGLAAVQDSKTGKWGFIDRTGQMVIPARYDQVGSFSEGVASVTVAEKRHRDELVNPKSVYIGRDGEKAVPGEYLWAGSFHEGLACVHYSEVDKPSGFIDKTGKLIVVADTYQHFSEGLAPAYQNDRAGFIDKTGKMVIKPRYADVEPFSDGLALVWTSRTRALGRYIDHEGRTVISRQFVDAASFSDGLAYVMVGRWESNVAARGHDQFIDKTGRKILDVKPPYMVAGQGLSEGLIPVHVTAPHPARSSANWNNVGYADKRLHLVIKPRFFEAGDFSEGLAPVSIIPTDRSD